jgi:hypothetical protein
LDEIAVRAQDDLVDPQATQEPSSSISLFGDPPIVRGAYDACARVHGDQPSRFGIRQPDDAHIGEQSLAGILHCDRHDVVSLREDP